MKYHIESMEQQMPQDREFKERAFCTKKKSNQHHMIGKAPVILENQPAHLPAS